MGVDFILKRTKTFKKSWDRGLVELATPDLFSQRPRCQARTAVAETSGRVVLRQGDVVAVQIVDGRLVGMKGLALAAHFLEPPKGILKAIQDGGGIAKGIVEVVHEISQTLEISIC